MNRSCLSIIVGVGLLFLARPAPAQTAAAKPKAPLNNAAGKDISDAQAEAVRLAKERRAQARSLLISLASDARSFRDQTLRARCLARIADVLWNVDEEQGRTLFRKAWEAAETGDRESQERLNIRGGIVSLKPSEITGPKVSSLVTNLNLREEVLKLAARRDRLLAEEFLQKLKADQQETRGENSKTSLWGLPEALQQRLDLARELLRVGDIERALQFADPVLDSVTISTVAFLTLLREKDPTAADQRYAAMLANAGGNTLSDPNTISLLSSYVFTPGTYVIFSSDGHGSGSLPPSPVPPASVSPQLRLAFFQTAAGILLRPQPSPEQDQSTAGIAGKYKVLERLMPLFEQYAPPEITVAMRGQIQALSSLISEGVRQGEDEWTQNGISPEKSRADQEQPLLDQIERAATASERDDLYFKLALLALSKDDMKARDHVSKIDEREFRKQAQAWVDGSLVIRAISKKKVETALELARIGELTHIQRVWILAQAAKLLAKTDRDKALSLLDDATAEARRIDGGDPDRPRGLLAIANGLKLFEPSRAWDAVFDGVRAANSTEGFTGEDGVLTLVINSKGQIRVSPVYVPDFDIEGIFGQLANDDYDRAVQLARGFQGEAPRAGATIAIARSLLRPKSTPVPAQQAATKN
jgi:hypothetical protein